MPGLTKTVLVTGANRGLCAAIASAFHKEELRVIGATRRLDSVDCAILDSHWLVDTNLTAKAVWEKLVPHVDDNDRFLIVGITRDYSGWLPKKAWEWINSPTNKLAA